MIEKFDRAKRYPLSPNFSSYEFDCRCRYPECQFTYIDSDLIRALELLRIQLGPIRILSGYRCTRHNNAVGGKPGSFHLLGKAADVSAQCRPSYLAAYAEKIPEFRNGGIGKYGSFVHLDVRGYKARWQLYTAPKIDDDAAGEEE